MRRLGTRKDDLLGLQEDGRETLHVLAGLRHLRRPRAGRGHDRLLRRAGRVAQHVQAHPGKFKDYIAIPKANGYQSLHTTLFGPFGTPLETQIRTHDMHRIAETGVAAHWLYKTAGELDLAQAQRETHRWLQSLLEIQSESRDSKEFLENIKGDLFPTRSTCSRRKARSWRCRAAPPPSISPTPFTPTSATTASPRGSTTN
jgi:hypothetical protein